MRTYEFTVILRSEEESSAKGKELIKNSLEQAGIKITKEEDLGIRLLSYPIKKEEKGKYIYYELEADPGVIQGLEKGFRLMTPILKFLFVRKDQ